MRMPNPEILLRRVGVGASTPGLLQQHFHSRTSFLRYRRTAATVTAEVQKVSGGRKGR